MYELREVPWSFEENNNSSFSFSLSLPLKNGIRSIIVILLGVPLPASMSTDSNRITKNTIDNHHVAVNAIGASST